MELSKLEVGQEALVIGNTSSHCFKTGSIISRLEGKALSDTGVNCTNGQGSSYVKRADLLCVGDKVTRGPDWDKNCPYGSWRPECYGTVKGFPSSVGAVDWGKHKVSVRWEDGSERCHRMTPDHQDLQPVGDSVDEGRPECLNDPDWEEDFDPCDDCPSSITAEQCHASCFDSSTGSIGDCPDKTTCKTCQEDCIRAETPKYQGIKVTCVVYDECSQIKEDSPMITRKQRARDLEKTKQEAVDARDAAIEKHEEDLAQRNESLDALDDQIAAMNDSVTDKEAHIKLIAKANKVDIPQAEAMYELDKLNE